MTSLRVEERKALQAIDDALRAKHAAYIDDVIEATGLSEADAADLVVDLRHDGLVEAMGSGQVPILRITEVTTLGRRALRENPPQPPAPAIPATSEERLPDTWSQIEGPVLTYTARALTQDPQSYVSSMQVSEALRLDHVHVADAMKALYADGFFEQRELLMAGSVHVSGLTPTARRRVGRWPDGDDSAIRALIVRLDELIAATTDVDDRSRLEKIRDGLAGLGKDSVVGLVAALGSTLATGVILP